MAARRGALAEGAARASGERARRRTTPLIGAEPLVPAITEPPKKAAATKATTTKAAKKPAARKPAATKATGEEGEDDEGTGDEHDDHRDPDDGSHEEGQGPQSSRHHGGRFRPARRGDLDTAGASGCVRGGAHPWCPRPSPSRPHGDLGALAPGLASGW